MTKQRIENPRVIVTRRLPDTIEARMDELFQTTLRKDDTPMSQSSLIAAVKNCDVLVPTVTDNIDLSLIHI